MKKTPLVGMFDSGIGGLTVLRECVRLLPNCRFLYYGDNDHVPYGSKTEEEIYSYTERAMEYFLRAGVNAAVLACNTATAVAAEGLRKRFPFPIVGLEPAVKPASEACKNVLVLATPRTAESGRLHRLVERFSCRFHIVPAPELAAAIERNLTQGEPFSIADYLPKGEFDGVVLGCTHYV
ncbi:MAG: glutamate racemase, partial [Clostridiales bacterium]|nr:glutamate racemase [Clostridiales bacterium]